MGSNCYSMVRGSAIRVTRLRPCGSIPDTVAYTVARCVASVRIDEVTDPGSTELLRSDEGDPRIILRQPEKTIRYTSDIRFINTDPATLSLLSSVSLTTNYNDEVSGFDVSTRKNPSAFALEVWSRLAGLRCDNGGPMYGYTVFPFLKGGIISGTAFNNGLVSFTITRARTQKNPKWNVGPYDIDGPYRRLLTPVSGNTAWRTFMTAYPPPPNTDGVQTLLDVVDGGTASATSPDILDGEFVTTSPWIVDGGGAS